MKLLQMQNGFLGFDEGVNFQSPYAAASAVVIPFGMELNVSYGHGTANGPAAIIEASHQVEKIDEQTFKLAYKRGIATIKEPIIPKTSGPALALLKKITGQVLKDKKFPLILGGEHSLTQGALAAICEKFSDVSLLQIDAHTDLRERYRGSIYSHGAVMRQSLIKLPIRHLTQVGIRSISDSELEYLKKNPKRVKTFWAWEKPSTRQILDSIPTKNVYITFDVDAFGPGVIPSTGTPEPGGLEWWLTLEILKTIFTRKNIVGCDIVELSPIKGLLSPDFTAARLAYKMIGYKLNR